jgi:hypothetical protein
MQRCAGPNDNPIDVDGSVVVVPTGGFPTVGLDETVSDLGCCNEGIHRGQLGNNKGLGGGSGATAHMAAISPRWLGERQQPRQWSARLLCGTTECPLGNVDIKAPAVRQRTANNACHRKAARVGKEGTQQERVYDDDKQLERSDDNAG